MRGDTARHERRLERFRAWARRSAERLCPTSHSGLVGPCITCGATR